MPRMSWIKAKALHLVTFQKVTSFVTWAVCVLPLKHIFLLKELSLMLLFEFRRCVLLFVLLLLLLPLFLLMLLLPDCAAVRAAARAHAAPSPQQTQCH